MGRRERLELEIKRRRLSYSEAAKALGVTKGMISHIVNCRHNPGWELQQRLVKFFGIPAEELLAVSQEQKGA